MGGDDGGDDDRPLAFASGYLLIWTGAGLAAYAVFEGGKELFSSDLAWHAYGRWLSAAVLVLAALYELTPLKRACLARCRHPIFTSRTGRGAWPAALMSGVDAGVWCVGCSWALMTALFALGVMSLTWMVLLAAAVAIQKLSPWPLAATVASAGLSVALAVGMLAAPHSVPGLVVPGGHSAASTMMDVH